MEAAGEEKTQEAVPEQKEITLSTSYGKVRGLFSDPAGEVVSFRGIRYGRAKRYAFAEEVFHAGEEVYDATAFGAAPYQHRAFLPETRFPEGSAGAFYYHEFREGVPFTYSDDGGPSGRRCLFSGGLEDGGREEPARGGLLLRGLFHGRLIG